MMILSLQNYFNPSLNYSDFAGGPRGMSKVIYYFRRIKTRVL